MKRTILFLTALITFSLSVLAQGETPKVIHGGVLNGKAVSLPKPAYPAEAREEKAEGAVAVDALIDENGSVISAVSQPYDQKVRKNDDGTPAEPREVHPALRSAAETAALSARFSPTLLSGRPVQVKGRIVYTFVAGASVTDVPGKIGGGILNGKATSLPPAAYPPAALAVRASGAVTVQVVVDEEGNVIAAQAVSGHPLLRPAAASAARQAKFSPTMLDGQPVKVSGVLTYNFVLAKSEEKPEN